MQQQITIRLKCKAAKLPALEKALRELVATHDTQGSVQIRGKPLPKPLTRASPPPPEAKPLPPEAKPLPPEAKPLPPGV